MNEKQTREQLIDKQLKSAGWISRYVGEEVNSVKSNFKNKEYVLKGKQIERCVGNLIDVLKNVSTSYLEDMDLIIAKALELRDSSMKRKKKDSVSVPGRLGG